MRKTGQNHSHPFFDPLYGASKTEHNNGPIMSRGTNGIIFGIPGPVVKKYQQKLYGGLEPLLIIFQKITDWIIIRNHTKSYKLPTMNLFLIPSMAIIWKWRNCMILMGTKSEKKILSPPGGSKSLIPRNGNKSRINKFRLILQLNRPGGLPQLGTRNGQLECRSWYFHLTYPMYIFNKFRFFNRPGQEMNRQFKLPDLIFQS